MQLDLNLLTALDALLEEGSVTGAADRLRLSPPALSRTLGRLRRHTGDDILVRTGRTMTPTPYALAIRDQVRDLVQQAHQVLAPTRELDLATWDRTFTLRCHDTLTAALAPDLLRVVNDQTPGVRLRFLAETAVDTDDLRHGRVDLEVGADVPAANEFRSETIGHDQLVVAMRRSHPYTQGFDLERFAAQPHVLVSRRGRLADPIDEILATHGLRRRVLASVGTGAAAAQVISGSDGLVTLPLSLSRPLIEAFGLVTTPLPVAVPDVPVVSVWHQRYDTDPGHMWLRAQVRAALASAMRQLPET
ncbi:LysR family transcriptional regulator [Actinoplanes sp. CA-131856]